MNVILDALITLISLVFLAILGLITAAAIPGLFSPVLGPWLDWIFPAKKR